MVRVGGSIESDPIDPSATDNILRALSILCLHNLPKGKIVPLR